MPTLIDIREVATRLDELLLLASSGVEVILTDGTTPRARLLPYVGPGARTPGLHPGAIQVAPDFDAPLPEGFWTGEP